MMALHGCCCAVVAATYHDVSSVVVLRKVGRVVEEMECAWEQLPAPNDIRSLIDLPGGALRAQEAARAARSLHQL